VTSRALSLLAAFASPVFLCAASAGWLYGLWPANTFTLAVSAFLVVGGPVLGIVHVATASEEAPAPPAPVPVAVPSARLAAAAEPEPLILTPKAAAARHFANWRDTPNAAITQRERARRASQYIRTR
jgi:hypothetical protein